MVYVILLWIRHNYNGLYLLFIWIEYLKNYLAYSRKTGLPVQIFLTVRWMVSLLIIKSIIKSALHSRLIYKITPFSLHNLWCKIVFSSLLFKNSTISRPPVGHFTGAPFANLALRPPQVYCSVPSSLNPLHTRNWFPLIWRGALVSDILIENSTSLWCWLKLVIWHWVNIKKI